MKAPRSSRHPRGWIGKRPQSSLRRRILEFIRDNPGATFRDIEALPGAKGRESIMHGENVLLWSGLSAPAIDAIIDMFKLGLIEPRGPDYYAYTKRRPGEARVRIVKLPALPVLWDREAALTEPHWFPAALFASDAWSARADNSRRN